MKKTQRPKWAKKLPARLWKHLQEQQQTKRPTLRQLKEDRAFQVRHSMLCWDCKEALDKVLASKGFEGNTP
jgi:hypothetical protein